MKNRPSLRQQKINWDDFRFFLALARHKTLSAAAREIDVTHATMSRRIQHLESDIGATLFDQNTDGFHLTDKGRMIFEEVRLMNDQVTNIQTITENEEPDGVVRISATPLLCDELVTVCLPEFIEKFPHVEVAVIAQNRNLSLARQEAHLSLRLSRPERGEFSIRRVALMQYRLYRARGSRSRHLSEPIICYTDELMNLPEMKWMEQELSGRRIAMRSNMLSCQKRAIEQGIGIGLLPVYAVRNSDLLEEIEVEAELPRREVWLAMRRTLVDVSRVRILAEFLAENFRSRRAVFSGSSPADVPDVPDAGH